MTMPKEATAGWNLTLQEEQEVLDSTLKALENELVKARDACEELQRRFDDVASERLRHQQKCIREYEEVLRLSDAEPYVLRVDFSDHDTEEPISYYISKRLGHNDLTASGGAHILSWSSGLARALNVSNNPNVDWLDPDGKAPPVRGTAYLKRHLEISDRQVQKIVDAFSIYSGHEQLGGDPYLQRVLRMSGPKARDIVATIGRDQDAAIFSPPGRTLVVDGVPGSGKTQVGQLRLAYLVSPDAGSPLEPGECVILSPSKALLHYMEDILPKGLGVRGVRQTTIWGLLADYVGVDLDGLVDDEVPWHTSPEFGMFLEQRFHTLTVSEVERLAKEAPFPNGDGWRLTRAMIVAAGVRLRGVPFSKRAEALARSLIQQVDEQLLSPYRRGGKIDRELFKSGHHEYKRKSTQAKAAIDSWVRRTSRTIDTVSFYKECLRSVGEPDGRLSVSDLPGLVTVKYLLSGEVLQGIRYVVLDEAQSVAPLTFRSLRAILPSANFTFLGDMAQRSPYGYSIGDWKDLEKWFGPIEVKTLRVNYRSAPPIVRFLNAISRNMIPRPPRMQSIPRNGDSVLLVKSAPERRAAMIAKLAELIERGGVSTVAVLYRNPEQRHGDEEIWRRSLTRYSISRIPAEHGVMISSSRQEVAGLEFDLVICMDIDGDTYPGTHEAAADLFLFASRAQNRLVLTSCGSMSELLTGRDIELLVTALSVDPKTGRDELRWEGQGSYTALDTGWGYAFPQSPSRRFMTGPTPGILEDRYDDESVP
jgi:DNA helicase-2/ATP-dependent DNA helicase PcrA